MNDLEKLRKKEKIFGKFVISSFIISFISMFLFGNQVFPVVMIISGVLMSFYVPLKNELIEKEKNLVNSSSPLAKRQIDLITV